jgi:insulysin
LFCDLVRDSLTEYAYDAGLAGLSYDLSADHRSLVINQSGYNDKMYVLAEKVVKRMRNLVVKPERLEVVKKQACLQLFIS